MNLQELISNHSGLTNRPPKGKKSRLLPTSEHQTLKHAHVYHRTCGKYGKARSPSQLILTPTPSDERQSLCLPFPFPCPRPPVILNRLQLPTTVSPFLRARRMADLDSHSGFPITILGGPPALLADSAFTPCT